MKREQQRQNILNYYVGGKKFNPEHDKIIIRQLKNQGYLRCRITSDISETLKTTDKGLIYLRSYGFNVEAPTICGGRICKNIA